VFTGEADAGVKTEGRSSHTGRFQKNFCLPIKNHQWACEAHEQRVLWLCWNLTCTNSGSYTCSIRVMWLLLQRY